MRGNDLRGPGFHTSCSASLPRILPTTGKEGRRKEEREGDWEGKRERGREHNRPWLLPRDHILSCDSLGKELS